MSIYKRGAIWWIYLKHRGRLIRRSTRTADRELAKRAHDELKARLWKERQAGKTLYDALAAWLDEAKRGRSDLVHIGQIRAIYGNPALIDVTPDSFADSFAGKSAAHYNRMLATLRASMNLAVRRGWIESAPKFSRRKVERRSFRWLTPKEWDALYAELADHLKPMAMFAVSTGLRWANVAGLTWDRVDLRHKRAWIDAGDAKARRAISVPLNASARAALRLAGTRKGFVFTLDGKPIKSPKTGWHRAVTRAGILPVRWHDLRHTWASWHVQNGTTLKALQELGGWASLEQVQIYAHLAPSTVASFADNVSVLRGKAA